MNTKIIISELEEFINNVDLSIIPYQKGNSLRIKNFIIRKNKSKNQYLIYNCENNSLITYTYFKISAIAIAKNLANNKNLINKILYLDNLLLKHYNDAVFYRHKIINTKDKIEKETRRIRLDVSISETDRIKQNLEDFIFN